MYKYNIHNLKEEEKNMLQTQEREMINRENQTKGTSLLND